MCLEVRQLAKIQLTDYNQYKKKGNIMAKIITFANNKGGSAKTTTTVIVAHAITLMLEKMTTNTKKVLVVDTDSQAHATLMLTGYDDLPDNQSLAGVLMAQRLKRDSSQELRDAIVPSKWHPNLHVLPASKVLDSIEEGLAGFDGNVFYLSRILQSVQDEYATIFIDTRPSFSLLTKMALLASDDVMIPVAPQYLDAHGLSNMINRVNDIRVDWGRSNPRVTGVVVVKLSSNVNAHKEIRESIKTHEILGPMYLGYVPINSEIQYAQAEHQSIFTFNPGASSAQAYADVSRRVAQKIWS